MRNLIIFFVAIIAILLTIFCFKAGYEVGKRSIIANPKSTINDLIKDFKKLK